jgi:hypothetical protein
VLFKHCSSISTLLGRRRCHEHQQGQQQQQQIAKHARIHGFCVSVFSGAEIISERKALSQAHGQLQLQACQMSWQPGWTDGCAKTVGDEGEQLFSYLCKFTGTTRNQRSAGAQ